MNKFDIGLFVLCILFRNVGNGLAQAQRATGPEESLRGPPDADRQPEGERKLRPSLNERTIHCI